MANISRRSFIRNAAVAGTGLTALTAAGVALADQAAPAEGADAPAEGGDPAEGGQGGGKAQAAASDRDDYPWGTTAPAIDDADVEEELEVEVVIVGVGLAGAAALRAAAEAGAASIAYFDKTEAGHSATGNQTAVINGKVQATWGRDGLYDIDEICNHEISEGCGFPKHAIWHKWAEGIADTFDWALEVMPDVHICADSSEDFGSYDDYVTPLSYPLPDGFDPSTEQNVTYTTSVQWTSNNFVNNSVERAAELTQVTGYPAHRVEQLIVEDGRVAGVYAYNYETGKYKKAHATKGVVLSCGDYSSNDEMVKYYTPAVHYNGVSEMFMTSDPEGTPANQGEAIKMATWAGVRVQEHHAPMIHHMGQDLTGMPGGMGIAPFLRVNKLGKRFMNEDQPGQQTENQIELQKDRCCYMIWDAKWCDEVDSFAPMHGSVYHFLEEGETISGMGSGLSQADLDGYVEQGSVLKADTIDDLLQQIADQYGLDVDEAKKSVERYNELANAGKDEDFGKVASRLFPLETAPFYASTMGVAAMLVIASGLESDEEAHTFDMDRNVMPGLYVAGNAQGDRFAVQYPIAMEGVDTSMCIFYGRVAGENVVSGK